MKMTMTRFVNERERWYRLEVVPNLFGEWLLIRTFGSLYQPKPIGMMVEVFTDQDSAMNTYKKLIGLKQKKGYVSPRLLKEKQWNR